MANESIIPGDTPCGDAVSGVVERLILLGYPAPDIIIALLDGFCALAMAAGVPKGDAVQGVAERYDVAIEAGIDVTRSGGGDERW